MLVCQSISQQRHAKYYHAFSERFVSVLCATTVCACVDVGGTMEN